MALLGGGHRVKAQPFAEAQPVSKFSSAPWFFKFLLRSVGHVCSSEAAVHMETRKEPATALSYNKMLQHSACLAAGNEPRHHLLRRRRALIIKTSAFSDLGAVFLLRWRSIRRLGRRRDAPAAPARPGLSISVTDQHHLRTVV